MTVKRVAVFQQANGYWRWRAIGIKGAKLANTAKPYSNFRDVMLNLIAVVNPIKRKIPLVITKKDGSKGNIRGMKF